MQQGALRRNGMSSSKYTRRAYIERPKMVIRKKQKNEWFNRTCELARLERENTWNKWREKRRKNLVQRRMTKMITL